MSKEDVLITAQRMQLNMVIIAMVEHTRVSCVIGNLAKKFIL
ncbi:Uncharacterised protein [Mycobacteroides abscessus subsp. massiliense]|nr:Uncharacterised protein [Mycobacteroides abscessus subsp. massiliense]